MPGDLKPSPLLVRFPLLGKETMAIAEWSIDSAYLTPTDSFSFTMLPTDDFTFAEGGELLELQPVELVVNGAGQLVGRIDKTRMGDHGYEVVCQGRDYIADLVECNVDPSLKLKIGDTLINAIMLATSPLGIDTVFSEDDIEMGGIRSGKKIRRSGSKGRGRRRGGKPVHDFKPMPGEGIYEFLNKIVARAGGTIQPGPTRNSLVIEEPLYEAEPHYRLRRTVDARNGIHNSIIEAYADRDYSRFPTYTMIHGTQARGGKAGANANFAYDLWAIAAGFRSELGKILEKGTVSDRWKPGKSAADQVKQGALYRLFVHRDEVARDAEQVERAARRALAERLKDTLEYSATLRGVTDPETGAIWSVNTMVQVDDDLCRVHEPLWIAERRLSYSKSTGAVTQLRCWRPESFQLSSESGADKAGGRR